MCLLGDAAHGISPHIGQGAALALEDTEVLTRCLKTSLDVRQASKKEMEQLDWVRGYRAERGH